jgi:hypothetical protein
MSAKDPGNTFKLSPCQILTLIFEFAGTLYISHEEYIKDGKVLANLGFRLKVLPGSLTDLSA